MSDGTARVVLPTLSIRWAPLWSVRGKPSTGPAPLRNALSMRSTEPPCVSWIRIRMLFEVLAPLHQHTPLSHM